MKEFIDKVSKRFVRVEVIEPVTITTKEHMAWSSSFTTYLVYIKTNHWAFSLPESEVRRRFSDFCWLRAKLSEHHPNKIVPPLPAKRYFHMTKFDPKVIQDRCQGLEKFIQRVMRSFVFLSDAALHLFFQSELSLTEIEAKLAEEIKPQYVKRMDLTSSSSNPSLGAGSPSISRRGPSRSINIGKPEFQRSVSDDGSNQSSLASSSSSNRSDENDSETLITSSCGGSSLGSDTGCLNLSKLELNSHSPIRTTNAETGPITDDDSGDINSHSSSTPRPQTPGGSSITTGITHAQIHSNIDYDLLTT